MRPAIPLATVVVAACQMALGAGWTETFETDVGQFNQTRGLGEDKFVWNPSAHQIDGEFERRTSSRADRRYAELGQTFTQDDVIGFSMVVTPLSISPELHAAANIGFWDSTQAEMTTWVGVRIGKPAGILIGGTDNNGGPIGLGNDSPYVDFTFGQTYFVTFFSNGAGELTMQVYSGRDASGPFLGSTSWTLQPDEVFHVNAIGMGNSGDGSTTFWASIDDFSFVYEPTTTVTIKTVPVGDPGNAADLRYNLNQRPEGFGRVTYDYRIGKYEVTAAQYTVFLNAVARTDTYGLYNTDMSRTDYGSGITRSGDGTVSNPYTYSVAPAFVNRPVNYVSWGDSARFVNWLHNGQPTGAQDGSTTEDGAYALNGATSDEVLLAVTRKADATWVIPNEDEWYKAAHYKGGSTNAGYFDYPTSSDAAPGQDMADLSGNNANYSTAPYAYPIDSGKYTTVVGQFQNSDSLDGTFDQGGNVWEWTEAVLHGSNRGLRGGGFDDGIRLCLKTWLRGRFQIALNKCHLDHPCEVLGRFFES